MKQAGTRVLGVVGSPRRGGNTDILVDEILKGAEQAGAETEKIMLADLTVAPCQACYACRTTGECAVRDDMAGLAEKMKASRVWVIGTPVYWWGPTAQLKAWVDRWFAMAGEGEQEKAVFEGRRIILAVPMGDTDAATGRHVVGMFTDALAFVRACLFASVLAPGAYEPGDVRKNAEVMKQARQAGHDAVAT